MQLHWSLHSVILKFIQGDAEVQAGTAVCTDWYRSLCIDILKFIKANIEIYAVLYWSLHMIKLKFIKSDAEVYKVVLS